MAETPSLDIVTNDTVEEGEPLEFSCPRCAEHTSASYYGPCASCCEALRAAQRTDGLDDDACAAAFEPKMHVIPNAVALKE